MNGHRRAECDLRRLQGCVEEEVENVAVAGNVGAGELVVGKVVVDVGGAENDVGDGKAGGFGFPILGIDDA